MSKLIDLEEILHEVKNRMLVPNLREAMACYYASSYRACIILSFNSLVDDLVEKLRIMKDVNNDAKRIYKNVSELIDKQLSFENVLIEQLVAAKIFSELDGEIYKIFQKLRHKSAHPSGFEPTAECARFIFTEIITRFLSQASLQTTARIDKLVSDISEGNFYIGPGINDSAKIVKSEISNIHPDAYAQLINRVYKKYTESNSKTKNPYLTFINALARIDDSKTNELIMKYVIDNNISKSDHEHLFVSLLSSNPTMFSGVENVCATRIIQNVKKSIIVTPKTINNSALRNPFYAILKFCNEGDGEIHTLMSGMMGVFIENNNHLCYFMRNIDKASSSKGRSAYMKLYNLILKSVTSNEIDKVDAICNAIMADDASSFEDIHNSRALEIIARLSFNTSGSSQVSSLIGEKFEQVLYLKEKAKIQFNLPKFSSTTLGKKLTKEQVQTLETIFS